MTIPSVINSIDGRTESIHYRSKLGGLKNAASISKIDIIDIRHDNVEFNLKADILSSLRPEVGPKTLPTLLLYDERGLQLFEEVSLNAKFEQSGYRANHEVDYIFRRILSHKCRN
jgi:L-histidine Nalpha-methyltransferase / hercynylcysteine S-oxide synthase